MLLILFLACQLADGYDADNDGYVACIRLSSSEDEAVPGQCLNEAAALDCDDGNPTVYPGALASCDDNLDHDCDGTPDYLAPGADCDGDGARVDADGDGYTPGVDDCDDRNSLMRPGGTEWCADGFDNDCDNVADESACEVI